MKFKRGITPMQVKTLIRISCKYAHLHIMNFLATTSHQILLSSFRGVALTKKKIGLNRLTDRSLTDGWVKNWIPPAAHCVGHNNAINVIWPKYYRYCVKQFIINQSINVTWRVKAYLSLIYHWTVWFLSLYGLSVSQSVSQSVSKFSFFLSAQLLWNRSTEFPETLY